MSKDTADITGTTGAEFKIVLSPSDPNGTTGLIKKAMLKISGQPERALPFSSHEITLSSPNNLSAGDSRIVVSILWGPEDSDAVIDVGSVMVGTASAANPKHLIEVDDIPGFVQLFGE